MSETSTTTSSAAKSKAAATKDAEPRVSQQAQFSTYHDADIPEDEQQNPPSGHQVEQELGEPHEGPVVNPLQKKR